MCSPEEKARLAEEMSAEPRLSSQIKGKMTALAQPTRLAALPNLLTASRIIAAPLLVAAHFAQAPWFAVALTVFAALTDFFDGIIARARAAASEFGAVLDPLADKVFIVTALVLLLADGLVGETAAWAAFAIVWRELLVSELRAQSRLEGFAVAVQVAAKAKTAVQFLAVIALFAAGIPGASAGTLAGWGVFLLWIAAALTLYTGAIYLWQAWRRKM